MNHGIHCDERETCMVWDKRGTVWTVVDWEDV